MKIIKFDRSGFTFAYYGKPFPVDSQRLKEELRDYGIRYAFIKNQPEPAQDAHQAIKDYIDKQPQDPDAQTIHPPTIYEIAQAAAIHKEAKRVTAELMKEARLGKMIDTDSAKDVVGSLVEQCVRSPEAFVNITRLKDFDNYTFTHSVNVSVLAIAIGKRMGFSAQELNDIGFAGLLHDIGKMQVPEAILNKPSKLSDDEFDIMKKHASLGYEYLKKDRKINNDILQAVRYHHEKSDGTGYPDGLQEGQIPKFAKIISIADVYDAITSERVYHKGMMPNEAVKALFSWSGKHFNDSLVKFFISIMGIYPVGTLVVLNTNELAIIMEPNKNDPMRPKVLIIAEENMTPIDPVYFDLATYNVVTHTPYKSIVSALDPRDFSININYTIEQYLKSNKII